MENASEKLLDAAAKIPMVPKGTVFVRMSSPEETAEYVRLLREHNFLAFGFDNDEEAITRTLAEVPELLVISRDGTGVIEKSDAVYQLRYDAAGPRYDWWNTGIILVLSPESQTEKRDDTWPLLHNIWYEGYNDPPFDMVIVRPINKAELLEMAKRLGCGRGQSTNRYNL